MIDKDLTCRLVYESALLELCISMLVTSCGCLGRRVDVCTCDRLARSLTALMANSGLSNLCSNGHLLLGEELLLGVLHEFEVVARALLHHLHGLLLLVGREDVLLGGELLDGLGAVDLADLLGGVEGAPWVARVGLDVAHLHVVVASRVAAASRVVHVLNALIRLEEEVLAVAELLELRLAGAVVDRVLLPVVLLAGRPLLSRRFKCFVEALWLPTLVVQDHLLDLEHGGSGHLSLAGGGGLPAVGSRLVGRIDHMRVPRAPSLQMRSWHAALCFHLSWYLQARTGIDDLGL